MGMRGGGRLSMSAATTGIGAAILRGRSGPAHRVESRGKRWFRWWDKGCRSVGGKGGTVVGVLE